MSDATTNDNGKPAMTCAQVAEDELVEKYVLGQLPEAEREVFEQHFFECPNCFEDLQNYQALHAGVEEAASAIRAEAEPHKARTGWQWTWVAATAAAIVVMVAVGWWFGAGRRGVDTGPPVVVTRPPAPRPSPSVAVDSLLRELARVEPPRYEPIVLRGATDAATRRFREAMQHYSKGDYAKAIPGLQAASKLDPTAARAPFFLGICLLLTNENGPAIQALQGTIALGESLYLEEAHFYLAKALLRTNDLPAAQTELRKTVELEGDLRDEAERLLRDLEALMKAPH